jgi:hypothetical protein
MTQTYFFLETFIGEFSGNNCITQSVIMRFKNVRRMAAEDLVVSKCGVNDQRITLTPHDFCVPFNRQTHN